jgi:hypothetical protein
LSLLTTGGAGRQNRRALIRERGWEARILAVLSVSTDSSDESVAQDVVSVLLQHCLLEGESASVTRLFATLQLFGDGGHFVDARRVAAALCERVAEQLAREHGAVGQACRDGGAAVLGAMARWLELHEALAPPSTLPGWAQLGLLCETALVVATSGGAGQASASLFGLVLRTSLAAVACGARLLDSASEREQRMSEIEAVLLSGMQTVAQPMVEALAKYKVTVIDIFVVLMMV